MTTILDTIVDTKKNEIALLKSTLDSDALAAQVESLPAPVSYKEALKKTDSLSLIAEIKKASPSKGVIRSNFNPLSLAKEFQQIGASALSVLTDVQYFQGHLSYLRDISHELSLPTLRKDFIIDPIQILEARAAGASAVLLIKAILSNEQCQSLLIFANELALSVLVEIHNQEELDEVLTLDGLEIIGINNRDLHSFTTSLSTSFKLIQKESRPDLVWVTESGYNNQDQLTEAQSRGFDAVLIGEGLATHPEIGGYFTES